MDKHEKLLDWVSELYFRQERKKEAKKLFYLIFLLVNRIRNILLTSDIALVAVSINHDLYIP